jgi:hypothetical protein
MNRDPSTSTSCIASRILAFFGRMEFSLPYRVLFMHSVLLVKIPALLTKNITRSTMIRSEVSGNFAEIAWHCEADWAAQPTRGLFGLRVLESIGCVECGRINTPLAHSPSTRSLILLFDLNLQVGYLRLFKLKCLWPKTFDCTVLFSIDMINRQTRRRAISLCPCGHGRETRENFESMPLRLKSAHRRSILSPLFSNSIQHPNQSSTKFCLPRRPTANGRSSQYAATSPDE